MKYRATIIFLCSFLVYAYFFQGSGWNQHAHFSTMRALVEDGTADVTRFRERTGDVTFRGDHVYSNKPPGIALMGVPFYFVLAKVEHAAGLDVDATKVWRANLYVMTVLLAAIPAAIANVQLFYLFRRKQISERTAMLMAGAFGFGSLSLPYAGIMMSHVMTATLILAGWQSLTVEQLKPKHALAGGLFLGLGILCDVLTVPVAAVLGVYLLARRAGAKTCITYCLATAWGVLATLLYNQLAQGRALHSGPFHPAPGLGASGMLFEQFGQPHFRRLYWITYHPMRGLFVTCPLFIACIISLFSLRRPIRISLKAVTLLAVLGVYVAFYLTFIGWTGGWSTGPRYLIPALPLLWLLAAPAWIRFPKICGALAALSIVQMLAVTSVNAQIPSPNSVLVDAADPVRACLNSFVTGQTNQTDDGFNLGELLHIPEKGQMIPIFALMGIFNWAAWKVPAIRKTTAISNGRSQETGRSSLQLK
jgi:hypothetical protein